MKSKRFLAVLAIWSLATVALGDEPRPVVVQPSPMPVYMGMGPPPVSGVRWTGTDLINYGGPCCGVPCAPFQYVPWYAPWPGSGHGCRYNACAPGCRY